MKHLPELDLLRGFAVVCMVLNHSGVMWLPNPDARDWLLSTLVFIGQFAPVLFFFVTGVGHGLRSPGGPLNHWDTAYKVLLLLFADWLLAPSLNSYYPDFLAFIAFSMALLHPLTRASNAVIWGLLLAVILGRFGGGVLLREHLDPDGIVLGVLGVGSNFIGAYVPCPWLAYPLAGCLVGRWLRTHDVSSPIERRKSMLRLASLGGGCSLVGSLLAYRGQTVFRWGTVSIAFFLISIAVVCFLVILALALSQGAPRSVAFLSVAGVASFAAVPIHYWLIHALAPAAGTLGSAAIGVASLALVIVVVVLARRFGAWATAWVTRVGSPRMVIGVGLGLAILFAAVALSVERRWGLHFAIAGQLLICGLLVNRIAARRAQASS